MTDSVAYSDIAVPVIGTQCYVLSEAGPELKARLDRIEEKLDRLLEGDPDADWWAGR